MEILTPELIQRFKEVGEQISNPNPLIIAKFYAPGNDREWYLSEYHQEADVFYGYMVKDGIGKRGYFRIPIQEGFNQIQIERDLEFSEVSFDLKK